MAHKNARLARAACKIWHAKRAFDTDRVTFSTRRLHTEAVCWICNTSTGGSGSGPTRPGGTRHGVLHHHRNRRASDPRRNLGRNPGRSRERRLGLEPGVRQIRTAMRRLDHRPVETYSEGSRTTAAPLFSFPVRITPKGRSRRLPSGRVAPARIEIEILIHIQILILIQIMRGFARPSTCAARTRYAPGTFLERTLSVLTSVVEEDVNGILDDPTGQDAQEGERRRVRWWNLGKAADRVDDTAQIRHADDGPHDAPM